jgi:hypothetical protein
VQVVSDGARLPTQVAIETYAVLTRLPPQQRASPPLAIEYLQTNFPDDPITLTGHLLLDLLLRLASMGIGGGAVYDAVVAESARLAGEELVTLDRRAMRIYEAIGARARLLA